MGDVAIAWSLRQLELVSLDISSDGKSATD
jgi:hypothetical protein